MLATPETQACVNPKHHATHSWILKPLESSTFPTGNVFVGEQLTSGWVICHHYVWVSNFPIKRGKWEKYVLDNTEKNASLS